jgi:hypothetical protein
VLFHDVLDPELLNAGRNPVKLYCCGKTCKRRCMNDAAHAIRYGDADTRAITLSNTTAEMASTSGGDMLGNVGSERKAREAREVAAAAAAAERAERRAAREAREAREATDATDVMDVKPTMAMLKANGQSRHGPLWSPRPDEPFIDWEDNVRAYSSQENVPACFNYM